MKYQNVHLLGAKRTPIGRLGGSLAQYTAADLAVAAAAPLVANEEVRSSVGQLILGQVLQAGCGMNVARQVALRLDLPVVTPAMTVNLMCGSGLQAVALAAGSIESGEYGLALAGGAESMSNAPHYLRGLRAGLKLGNEQLEDAILRDGLTDPLLGIGMGETAETLATKFGISRQEQDAFAARSQALYSAISEEITPVEGVILDEHPRKDSTAEKLAKLKPAFRSDGTVTAGNASGVNDGAAMVLVGSEAVAGDLSLASRARIVASAVVGCDPAEMGLGPVEAIRAICREADWDMGEVDLFEINEAFAVQVLACARLLGLISEKLNVRGGAIALGHPIGASGARVLCTLLHSLEERGLARGIAALCIGGGMGIAIAIER
ncbi:MAG: thiolase family protein [Verrucomicrobiaceae bacterium]|nr:thiolase family protein [Verrucomicrobiaceae bacterium]